MLILRTFVLNQTETTQAPPKKGSSDFEDSHPFKRPAGFYGSITRDFKLFHYFTFETSFLQNAKSFLKNWSVIFWFKSTLIENTTFL